MSVQLRGLSGVIDKQHCIHVQRLLQGVLNLVHCWNMGT